MALGAIAVVVALLVQLLIAVNGQLEVDLIAREAARAASRAGDPPAAARRAVADLDARARVDVEVDGVIVTVIVQRPAPAIARLSGRSDLIGRSAMALEPP